MKKLVLALIAGVLTTGCFGRGGGGSEIALPSPLAIAEVTEAAAEPAPPLGWLRSLLKPIAVRDDAGTVKLYRVVLLCGETDAQAYVVASANPLVQLPGPYFPDKDLGVEADRRPCPAGEAK